MDAIVTEVAMRWASSGVLEERTGAQLRALLFALAQERQTRARRLAHTIS
jgi:hypothetical protein